MIDELLKKSLKYTADLFVKEKGIEGAKKQLLDSSKKISLYGQIHENTKYALAYIDKKYGSGKNKVREKNRIKKNDNIFYIKIKKTVSEAGKGYGIEYEADGKIYKHRLSKSRVYVGKGIILITGKNIKWDNETGINGG